MKGNISNIGGSGGIVSGWGCGNRSQEPGGCVGDRVRGFWPWICLEIAKFGIFGSSEKTCQPPSEWNKSS